MFWKELYDKYLGEIANDILMPPPVVSTSVWDV